MLRNVVEEALLEARRALLSSLSKGLTQIEGRGKFGDYSRKFDVLTEKAIIDVVKKRLDKAYIISEEVGHIPCEDPEYYVLIDPVDGSTNAAHGIPFFASSIAIAESPELESVIAAGVIEHSTGKLYIGERGEGVYVDGKPATLRSARSLKDALILIDLAALKKEYEDDFSPRRWCTQIISNAKHARFLAAASLEIAYMLEGKADAYACVCRDLKIMDFCASISLLKWAGGEYRIIGEEEFSLTQKKRFGIVVASTKDLTSQMMDRRFFNDVTLETI